MPHYCRRCGTKMRRDQQHRVSHKRLRFLCPKCGRVKLIKPKKNVLPYY